MIEHFIMLGLAAFGIGFIIAFWIKGKVIVQKVKAAEAEAHNLIEEAKRKSETLLKEANLEIKEQMAQELLSTGLSRKAVERILNFSTDRNL